MNVWQKGNALPTFLIKTFQTGCVWLFFILLKGPCKTSPPNLKSWFIAMRKISDSEKKSLSKGLVSTIQLLQKKTSDRYCLTQKPVSLPRGKSWYTSMDVPMLPSHLRLLIAWSCSSNQQMEERLDCHKHTKDGQALLCSTPGGSWLLLMALVKEKLWTLYYYVFLLFLIVSKVEAYF